MDKQKWIILVRDVLNFPHTSHLFDIAEETEDILELKQLLKDAKNITKTYIHDYNVCLDLDFV